MGVMRSLLLSVSENRKLRETLPRYRVARNAVKRFMPGERLDDALHAGATFTPQRIGVVFTRLGENILDLDAARFVTDHYIDALNRIAQMQLDAQISIKLTQLGLDISKDAAEQNLRAIIEHAGTLGNMVWIDMEQSSWVDVTLELFRNVRRDYENVGVCLQSYLRRTDSDLDALMPFKPAIRLVKGAYMEPPEVAYPDKREVDEQYYRQAMRLIRASASGEAAPPVIATHDMRIVDRICAEAQAAGISRDAYEFTMLFGIRRDAQQALATRGQRMRVLISYGENWFPWFMRRLAERPANLLFVAKSFYK